jgi:hypothetical protein
MNPKGIVDLRIYRIRPRRMTEFLHLAGELLMPVQLRHLGAPIAFYATDIGPQDELIHLWGYDNLADMEARRAARDSDPLWQGYLDASDGLIHKQETRVVTRVPLTLPNGLLRPASDKPLVDFRVSTVRVRSMPALLKLFETIALPVHLSHGEVPLAVYVSEIGPLNELIELWPYDSLADMEARQALRRIDPSWVHYSSSAGPLIESEQTRAVRRATFARPG